MTIIHRKQIVLAALILMVAVAGYLNWRYEANGSDTSDPIVSVANDSKNENLGEAVMVNQENDYFTECRNNRESVRSKTIGVLNEVVNNANSTQEAKDKAQAEIVDISKNISDEANIENLIKAKGFSDVVVFINNGSVTVTVKANGLTAPQTAKIKDIVIEQTGNNNIKIVEVD